MQLERVRAISSKSPETFMEVCLLFFRYRGFYLAVLEITVFPPDIGFSHAADECVARFKASPLHSLDIAKVALTMC